MAKRKNRKANVAPRLGPPTNLRPAGAHKDARRPTRAEAKRLALRDDL